jgi:hypothetical protein
MYCTYTYTTSSHTYAYTYTYTYTYTWTQVASVELTALVGSKNETILPLPKPFAREARFWKIKPMGTYYQAHIPSRVLYLQKHINKTTGHVLPGTHSLRKHPLHRDCITLYPYFYKKSPRCIYKEVQCIGLLSTSCPHNSDCILLCIHKKVQYIYISSPLYSPLNSGLYTTLSF